MGVVKDGDLVPHIFVVTVDGIIQPRTAADTSEDGDAEFYETGPAIARAKEIGNGAVVLMLAGETRTPTTNPWMVEVNRHWIQVWPELTEAEEEVPSDG